MQFWIQVQWICNWEFHCWILVKGWFKSIGHKGNYHLSNWNLQTAKHFWVHTISKSSSSAVSSAPWELSNERARISQEEFGILPMMSDTAQPCLSKNRDRYQPWKSRSLICKPVIWHILAKCWIHSAGSSFEVWLVVSKNLKSSRWTSEGAPGCWQLGTTIRGLSGDINQLRL